MEQNTWFVIKPCPDDVIHYGVRGQEHGKRRWQNKDGSLTPAGRIHYGYGPARQIGGPTAKSDDGPTVEGKGTSRYERSTGKTKTASKRDYRDTDDDTTTSSSTSQQKGKKKQDNRNTDTVDGKYRKVDNSGDPAMDGKWETVGGRGGNNKPPGNNNSSGSSSSGDSGGNKGEKKGKDPVTEKLKNKAKLRSAEEGLTKDLSKILGNSIDKATQRKMDKMNLDYMSDEDLRNAINRYNLERQYKQIAVGNVATGRQKLQGTLEIAGSVLAVGASAATIASIIHELKKG